MIKIERYKRYESIFWKLFFSLILIGLSFILFSVLSTNIYAQTTDVLTDTTSTINSNGVYVESSNIPSNIAIYLPKNYYSIDETVLLTVVNTGMWVDTNNDLYMEILSIDSPDYSLKYLGSILDPISFIPQIPGEYVVRLLLNDASNAVISQTYFSVGTDYVNSQSTDSQSVDGQFSSIDASDSQSDNLENLSTINNIVNISNETHIDIVKYSKFKGATTDFKKHYDNLSELKKMSDVIIDNPGVGSIKWHNTLDVLNADIDNNIQILPGEIVVNSETLDASFNSSATLTIHDIYFTSPIVLRNNNFCSDCKILSYANSVLTFDVSGFSNYSVVENTSLIIWDNNEQNASLYRGNITKYVDQNVEFYSNYTNQTDGAIIIGADCFINLSTDPNTLFSMIYNSTIGLYFYETNFMTNGIYTYTIACNQSSFYTLNVSDDLIVDTAGDLNIENNDITFSDEYSSENENIVIYALIHSLIDYSYTDVLIRFYDGNPDYPDYGIQIGADLFVNVSGIQDISVNTTWVVPVGLHNIYVEIDPLNDIDEMDKTNNIAHNTNFVSAWQTYYGNVTILSRLGGVYNNTNKEFINWSAQLFPDANIYVASPGSSINWLALQAFSRNSSGDIMDDTLNDFSELDLSLGIENFTDSVNNTYTSGGYPIKVSDYTLFYRIVANVPEIESTNNTNFYTGLLWDTSDTMSPYYMYESDPSFRTDVVFVTKLNYNKPGAYGIYDYELSVPAFLRDYKLTGETIQLYYEIQ